MRIDKNNKPVLGFTNLEQNKSILQYILSNMTRMTADIVLYTQRKNSVFHIFYIAYKERRYRYRVKTLSIFLERKEQTGKYKFNTINFKIFVVIYTKKSQSMYGRLAEATFADVPSRDRMDLL